MIDGLEDYQHRCKALNLLLDQTYEYDKKIKLIIASQPCDQLERLNQHIDTPLEIRGFTNKGIQDYADKFLRESQRMGLKVDLTVVSNLMKVITPVINTDESGAAQSMTEVGYLSHVPINLMIMCSLRCLTKSEIPATWLLMCESLFNLILKKAQEKNPNLDDTVLDALGELALDTLR